MERTAELNPQGGERLVQLELHRLVPSIHQPRKRFSKQRIEQLARSIESQGVVQPLVVRPHPREHGRFELVAGERRLRALKLLGRDTAPVLVRAITDGQLLEASLVENLQREQLTPIEEAQAYRNLLDHHGYTQETLADRVGKERSTIANLVRLLGLPPALRQDLEEERLSTGHARTLLALEDPALQLALRDLIVKRDLSVREAERYVKRARKRGLPGGKPRHGPAAKVAEDPKLVAVKDALESRLGTRVTISKNAGERGKIEIEYYSVDDLNRILDKLL
ncbi:MAG: ParB/RepB/Spo0J family partition protein [SAR324 cluster bacterium]|nr:ParB/RepB/Spo0J family partition protein [SAR324 cluster bacterium]MCZ6557921.1 ParB/RepB/Spo0J family partition protein [SAR324 cluster bacterium]MCZ6629147.1 ParB/RepB/Spo0J family partition protein [SAR324 cluster bacterium]MCZ6645275.1 ParB/RepB/Spo0J family partition protein [SAR324 cluster bacterium]MCZ6843796.1 ParB/RepB/Spo0J family partition protein [SAR324 cluster bacterium]